MVSPEYKGKGIGVLGNLGISLCNGFLKKLFSLVSAISTPQWCAFC